MAQFPEPGNALHRVWDAVDFRREGFDNFGHRAMLVVHKNDESGAAGIIEHV